jgi:YD repeat-containing protein
VNCTLKDGGLHLYYVNDLEVFGGLGLKIERFYNSTSNEIGIFGPKWGFNYESFITVGMENAAVIYDSRSRVLNFFSPANFSPVQFRESVNKIGRADERNGSFGSLEEYEFYLSELTNHTLLPTQQLKNMFEENKQSIDSIPVGTEISSLKLGYEEILRLANGYSRRIKEDRVEYFDTAGRLIRIEDKDRNWIEIEYKESLIDRIINSNGHQFVFEYNDIGLVEKIQANNGLYSTYEYDKEGQLIKTTNSKGEETYYQYRDDGSGYLTLVVFPDERSIEVFYTKSDNYVQMLKRRNGSITTYKYNEVGDPIEKEKVLKVSVKHMNRSDSKSVDEYEVEYYFNKDEIGIDRLKKQIERRDGKTTEIIYVDNSETLPLLKTENGIPTHFEYDYLWRLVREENPNNIIEYDYHGESNKRTYVAYYRKDDEGELELYDWYLYEYNSDEKISYAEDASGKSVEIGYDTLGRIASLLKKGEERPLVIKMNEADKPTQIRYEGIGSIAIEYDEFWEITKTHVDPEDSSMANLVITMFNDLLSLIEKANIE